MWYSIMELKFVIYMCLIAVATARYPMNGEAEVRHFLLNQANHSSRERPVLNESDTVHVLLTVQLYAMLDLDEKNEVITLASWLTLAWKDERMTWDPSNFRGVDLVHMYVDEIWTPKIILSNSVSEDTLGVVNAEKGSILLTSNGDVLLGVAVVQSTDCPISIKFFPFDFQACPLQFIPENLLIDQVHLYTEPSMYPASLGSTEWDLRNITTGNVRIPTVNYVSTRPLTSITIATVCIHLERDPSYYISTLLIPSTFLCLMACVTFLAPPDSGERISLGVSMVLGLTVFQLLVVDTLPASSKDPPLVGKYLTGTFVLACLTVPLSMMNINIAFGDSRLWILKYASMRNIFLEVLPTILRVPTYRERVHGELIVVRAKPAANTEIDTVIMTKTDIPPKKSNTVEPLPSLLPPMDKKKISPNEKSRLEARTVALVMDKIILICFFISFGIATIIIFAKFEQNPGVKACEYF